MRLLLAVALLVVGAGAQKTPEAVESLGAAEEPTGVDASADAPDEPVEAGTIAGSGDGVLEKTGKYGNPIDYTNYMCHNTRQAPDPDDLKGGLQYVLTEARLREIRGQFLYCFFDQGGSDGNGDYQTDIHNSIPQIHKNFNFQLPFFGFRFNYTRLSLNGYLEFSDPPPHYTYPLVFPNKDWPKQNDPSFIGIFFTKSRIGKIRQTDIDQRKPGVYFRLERDLQARKDQFGVEMRERVKWDIREGIVGADTFDPKHAVVITWKNISFAGGIDNSLYKTNTFQMVLATDEVFTYAIFNYIDLQWTTHTEAGGDTTNGEGGTPAYVGFNAGNGTRSKEYSPYSQASTLRDLVGRGWANGFPGRHIFRIDENIMLGNCNKDIAGANLPLVFAPESGNMLGGTIVNITGPCFEATDKIKCRFDYYEVPGIYVDSNRAMCIQPYIPAEGYIRFEVAINDGKYNWKGKYFVETAATSTERIFFVTDDVHKPWPPEIKITWNAMNLTTNAAAAVRISLWGYRETTIRPELLYIGSIAESITNAGTYIINPGNYRDRDNYMTNDLQFGFLQINLTTPFQTADGSLVTPVMWSRPIPLGWYFAPQWERKYGTQWADALCNKWIMNDRYLKNFAHEVPQCPCTLQQALADRGRYLPDFNCDKDANPSCYYNEGAVHCVRTGSPSMEGSEQQCCYDKNGYVMLSYDQQWGSRPHRSHNLGLIPWNEANKVPTLSHWFHDVTPFYLCCLWQDEQAIGCETLRFERRPSQDCIAYQSPGLGVVFGDPHIITFDGLEYTFNGKGEFSLLHVDSAKLNFDVQGRFEQMPVNRLGEVMATQLTAVAAKQNNSAVIEVRVRPRHSQWRYRLDVLVNSKRVYFDRPSLRVQHFPEVTVYMPPYVLNQSEIIMMFQSGAGIEIVENDGYMTARVYLPWSYINQTRGLLGNWSFDILDDFTLPNGNPIPVQTDINNFERIHKDYAINWMLSGKATTLTSTSLFTYLDNKDASYYNNVSFVPEYRAVIEEIIPPNRTEDRQMAKDLCGDSYQCQYDYAMTLNRDAATFTKNYRDSFTEIKAQTKKTVISCGVLETPRFGRKSTFLFVPDTKVTFECNQDFVLVGDQRRLCLPSGKWDMPEYGFTECLRQQEYSSRQAGITFGVILAVLVPLLLILICLGFKLIRRYHKSKAEEKALSNRATELTWARIAEQDPAERQETEVQ